MCWTLPNLDFDPIWPYDTKVQNKSRYIRVCLSTKRTDSVEVCSRDDCSSQLIIDIEIPPFLIVESLLIDYTLYEVPKTSS